jgi:hypothetical protein
MNKILEKVLLSARCRHGTTEADRIWTYRCCAMVAVMVHLLMLVAIRANGVTGESNVAMSDAVPRQLSVVSRWR